MAAPPAMPSFFDSGEGEQDALFGGGQPPAQQAAPPAPMPGAPKPKSPGAHSKRSMGRLG